MAFFKSCQRFFLVSVLTILVYAITVQAAEEEGEHFSALLNDDLINSVTLGTPEDVKILLEKGANPNLKDAHGFPMIAIAAEREGEAGATIARALLAGGADIDATNPKGETALHNAIKTDHDKLVWLLLSEGANFYLMTTDGQTPLDYARKENNPRILRLVEKAIAIDRARKEQARSGENMKKMLYHYAYYHCALTYMKYYVSTVSGAKNNEALSAEQFEKREEKILHYQQKMLQLFALDNERLSAIGRQTRHAITEKLDSMISTRNRLKKGFGTQGDVERRCHKIARSWKVDGLTKEAGSNE